MSWQPLVRDAQTRALVLATIRDLGDELARDNVPPTDHALLRTYLAQDDTIRDVKGRGEHALSIAIARVTESGVGLYGGAAGVGWTVAHVASGEVADEACTRIDELLTRLLAPAWTGDFDLISGLVGFGLYALDRGDAGDALATRVLDQLEALAKPRGEGLAWFTPPEQLPDHIRARTPEGHWDLGVAHGTPGVIGLLARYVVADVDTDRARRLLDGAVAFVCSAKTGEHYPNWLVHDGHDTAAGGRLAWCYGDLGVSTALLGAALATESSDWRNTALDLARSCAARTDEKAAVEAAHLCHGAFGIAHMFARIHQVTDEPVFAAASRRWLDRGLAKRSSWPSETSFLEGRVGITLALHAAVSEVEPGWDRLMLLDVG